MKTLAAAVSVIHAATGEEIVSARRLTDRKTLQDIEVVTETGRIFTVTANAMTSEPVGHFFEGTDPSRARLQNFTVHGDINVDF